MDNPLKDLDAIHVDEQTKAKTLHYVLEHQKKPRHQYRKPMILLCAAATLFIVMLLPKLWQKTTTTTIGTPQIASIVTLDINPSIELSLNSDGEVIQTKAYNADGTAILEDVDLRNQAIEDALQLLFADSRYQSYLRNGILEVGVYAEDETRQTALENQISSYLKTTKETPRYHCSSIDQETHEEAQEHHTSMGKYRVIELIRSYDSSYRVDELSTYSMKKLYALLEQYDEDAVPEGCHSEGGNGKGHHGKRYS